MASTRRVKKSFQNIELAEKISAWAYRYKLTGDFYISNLVSALRERKNLHIWASLDPNTYLPQPQINVAQNAARLARLMVVIRNILVFAPVALTWAAVGQASSGFARYIEENETNVVNFLDFWQNGYGYLGEEWLLSKVAFLDFIIILIVIFLTLLASIMGRKASDRQMVFLEEADRERLSLAIDINTFLFDKQKVTNVTMNKSLAGAISKLLNATDSLEEVTKNLAKTVKRVEREN